MKYKLRYPIKYKNHFSFAIGHSFCYDEIELRRPTVGDTYGLDFSNPKTTHKNMIILISRISDIKIQLIEKLDMVDWDCICQIVNRMIVHES